MKHLETINYKGYKLVVFISWGKLTIDLWFNDTMEHIFNSLNTAIQFVDNATK